MRSSCALCANRGAPKPERNGTIEGILFMPPAVQDETQPRSRIAMFLAAPERVALVRILLLGFSTLGVLFLLDAAVFRSGFYTRYIEPNSAAGEFETVFHIDLKNRFDRPHRALVLGDSQIAEGFSAQVANQATANSGWEFLSAGIGGASMRNWYYLLRDVDPHRSRFDVVVLPLRGYSDVDDGETRADRELDIRWMIARLRLTDLPELAASFPTRSIRFTILRESLFEGLVYRRDVRELLRNWRARMRDLADCRLACEESFYAYSGRSEDLSGLRMNWTTMTLQFPPNLNPVTKADMIAKTDFQNWSVRGVERAYRKTWLGRIIDRYRGTHTRIIILSLPYRPFPIPLVWPVDSGSFILEAAKDPGVTIADEHLFSDLQRPDYFFDVFHMNRKGREIFSRRLAGLVAQTAAGNAQ